MGGRDGGAAAGPGRRRRAPSADWSPGRELSRRYLGGRARPVSVRWVDNQKGRWGSCTPVDGTIRMSSRLRGMPSGSSITSCCTSWRTCWSRRTAAVLGPARAVSGLERARGYLEGVAATARLDMEPLGEWAVARPGGERGGGPVLGRAPGAAAGRRGPTRRGGGQEVGPLPPRRADRPAQHDLDQQPQLVDQAGGAAR